MSDTPKLHAIAPISQEANLQRSIDSCTRVPGFELGHDRPAEAEDREPVRTSA